MLYILGRIIDAEYSEGGRVELKALAVTVLGLLREGPMHPYEMFQVLRKRGDDQVIKVSPGALYHAVEKLEESGLVRIDRIERESNRPERTVYALEPSGERAATDWVISELSKVRNEYPVFPVALAVAPKLPWRTVRGAFEQRIKELHELRASRIERLNHAREADISEIFLLEDTYLLEVQTAQLNHMQRTIDLVESGALTWP
ncbi:MULTISPECIES: PadR family transcriptional regulator [Micrococcaceae]|uniref:PadR family transcriptional regulator n=1 Tax=unclassified Kocuria TaxID=2649579 RepID=UPI0010111D9D|nr:MULTISPECIES: PadR family transcriptional regulator [unclassified Kocuria]